MARTPVNPLQNGDAAAKLTGGQARQGQNIKGMIWVLGAGVALVAISFALMLAFQSQPVTPGNQRAGEQAPQAAPIWGAAGAPETAQSPS
jgi:hypothetical protein